MVLSSAFQGKILREPWDFSQGSPQGVICGINARITNQGRMWLELTMLHWGLTLTVPRLAE